MLRYSARVLTVEARPTALELDGLEGGNTRRNRRPHMVEPQGFIRIGLRPEHWPVRVVRLVRRDSGQEAATVPLATEPDATWIDHQRRVANGLVRAMEVEDAAPARSHLRHGRGWIGHAFSGARADRSVGPRDGRARPQPCRLG